MERSVGGEVSSDVEERRSQRHIPWKMLRLELCSLPSHAFTYFFFPLCFRKKWLEAYLSHLNLLLPWWPSESYNDIQSKLHDQTLLISTAPSHHKSLGVLSVTPSNGTKLLISNWSIIEYWLEGVAAYIFVCSLMVVVVWFFHVSVLLSFFPPMLGSFIQSSGGEIIMAVKTESPY